MGRALFESDPPFTIISRLYLTFGRARDFWCLIVKKGLLKGQLHENYF